MEIEIKRILDNFTTRKLRKLLLEWSLPLVSRAYNQSAIVSIVDYKSLAYLMTCECPFLYRMEQRIGTKWVVLEEGTAGTTLTGNWNADGRELRVTVFPLGSTHKTDWQFHLLIFGED